MTKSRFYLHCGLLFSAILALYFAMIFLAKSAWHMEDSAVSSGPVGAIIVLTMIGEQKLLNNQMSLKRWYLAGIAGCVAGTAVQIMLNLLWP
jgi:hypothetical protein